LAEQFRMCFQPAQAKLKVGVPVGEAQLTDKRLGVVQGVSLRWAFS